MAIALLPAYLRMPLVFAVADPPLGGRWTILHPAGRLDFWQPLTATLDFLRVCDTMQRLFLGGCTAGVVHLVLVLCERRKQSYNQLQLDIAFLRGCGQYHPCSARKT